MKELFWSAVAVFSICPLLIAQDGSLDSSFGSGGIVATAIGSNNAYGFSVAVQSDGKIVVAGGYKAGDYNNFATARYETNGSLDVAFGTGGVVTTPIGSLEGYATSVALAPDGKIIAAGFVNNGTTDTRNYDFALVRYRANGSLDSTFNSNGIVTTAVGGGDDIGYSVELQTDGKIVVAGASKIGGNYHIAVVRYNIDGSLDTTFGSGGKVVTAIGSYYEYGQGLAIQSDGKITVAGRYSNGAKYDFAVLRYNSDGSPDSEFGKNGIDTTAVGSNDDYAFSVAIQRDNKIVVGGYSNNGAVDNPAVVRYNENGSLDSAFGKRGMVKTAIASGNSYSNSVIIQPDGKIVLTANSNGYFTLVRYNENGQLDSTFGTGGQVTAGVSGISQAATSQADGKIIVAGMSLVGSYYEFTVARYNNPSIESLQLGLIAWYPLNGNGNDSSGSGHNATVNGVLPAMDRFGKMGMAYSFNGVSSSITTGISLLNNLTGLTATGWIYPTTLGTRIGFFGQNDLFEFGFLDTTDMDAWLDRISKGVLVPTTGILNGWHMVTATADSDSLRFYVDGLMKKSMALGVASFGSTTYDFNIGGGGIFDPTGNYFSGSIDDIRIYNRALTTVEVQTLYHEGGWIATTSVASRHTTVANGYELSQNYPNPFNPTTTISYDLPKMTQVTLKIFDMLGREVATLINEQKQPGSYQVAFDGSRLASGVYFYRMEAGSFVQTKKLVVLK